MVSPTGAHQGSFNHLARMTMRENILSALSRAINTLGIVSTLLGQLIPVIQVQEMKLKPGLTLPPRHICAVEHANQRRSHAQDMYNYRGHYSTYEQRWAEHQGEHVDSNCSRVESTSRRLTVARTLCPVIDDDGVSVLPHSGVTHTHTHSNSKPSWMNLVSSRPTQLPPA